MGGPLPRRIEPRDLQRRQFQAAAVETLNRHAGALTQLGERVQAQGEFMADLAVSRDTLQQDLAALSLPEWLVSQSTFRDRLRWLILGR